MDPQFVALVYPALACLPRLAAIFTLLPLFGKRTIQGMIRAEFIVVLAAFLYPMAVAGAEPPTAVHWSGWMLLLISLKETLLGVVIGFFLGLIFWVAENVGYLIDLQTGTNNLLIFDPVHDHQEGPTATLMLQIVLVLVLAGGGLLTLLDIIFDSYRIWPVFDLKPRMSEVLSASVTARADALFGLTVRFAAPIIVLLLLIELGLGFVNRAAESIDVYALAMPIKSTVAFLVLMIFLSFIYDAIGGLLAADSAILRVLAGSR